MVAKTVFLICAQALIFQVAFGQVTGNSYVNNDIYISGGSASSALAGLGLGSAGLGVGRSAGLALGGSSGLGLAAGKLSSGVVGTGTISLGGGNVVSSGPLLVTAISPIGPSGLAVASENAIEGNLLVTGQLPFLSAVAFEGALPTAGSGVATCGCGSGTVGITSEGVGRASLRY